MHSCSSRRWPTAGSRRRGKGVGRFHLEVEGRAAHAGVAPQDGRSAIVELAHQVLRLQDLEDLAAGTTITVGVIQGGTTANVVPARASADIDVRVASREEQARVDAALQALTPGHSRRATSAGRVVQQAAVGANLAGDFPVRAGAAVCGDRRPRHRRSSKDRPEAAATATSPRPSVFRPWTASVRGAEERTPMMSTS